MYFFHILFAVLLVTSCNNNNDVGDPLKKKIAEFQKQDRAFSVDFENGHGEDIEALKALCGKDPPVKIYLSFAAGTNKGRFYCDDVSLFADFSYKGVLDPAGLTLKFADIKFAKNTQEKFLNGTEYLLAPALEAPAWFFDEKQNTIGAVFSFDPKNLTDVKVDFAKGEITCANGDVKKIEEAGLCWIMDYLLFKKNVN